MAENTDTQNTDNPNVRLEEGQAAPQFSLLNADGETVSLSDYKGKKVIVYFYPKADTPGCTTEACDFRDNLASLQGAGYTVLGVSPDLPEALRAFRDEQHLSYSLLSDPDYAVARAYGAYGSRVVGEQTFTGTQRSTFVVGKDGRLAHAEYDVDPNGHVLRLREALGL